MSLRLGVLATVLALSACGSPSSNCPATYARLADGTCVCPSGTHELHAACVADGDAGDTPDGGVDGGHDAAMGDAGPPHCDPWAELTAPTCGNGMRCAVPVDGSSTGDCVPDGTTAIGTHCVIPGSGYDPCIAGSACDQALGVCLAYCSVPSANCADATTVCFGDTTTHQGICYPRCDMFDATSADCHGGVCLAGVDLDGVVVGSCFADESGTRAIGMDCTDSPLCVQGGLCGLMVPSLFSMQCLPLCQGTNGSVHGCGSGLHCNMWSGSGDIGVCQP